MSAAFFAIAPAIGVLVSFAERIVRTRSRRSGPGALFISVGGVVILFSLFGLLLGPASIGVVGAMLVISRLVGDNSTQSSDVKLVTAELR